MNFTLFGFSGEFRNPFVHKCKFVNIASVGEFQEEAKYGIFYSEDKGRYTRILQRCKCGIVRTERLKGSWTSEQLGIKKNLTISDEELKKLVEGK